MGDYLRVEELEVYKKLCRIHIEVCELTRTWPPDERYELTSQVRRSSNSSPANLAEKHSDRHIRNKIEGVNRARGEALETVHHLYMAKLKGYLSNQVYQGFRGRYLECVRMLNGMERTFEKHLDESSRRWPSTPSTRPLNADTDAPHPEP